MPFDDEMENLSQKKNKTTPESTEKTPVATPQDEVKAK